MTASLPFTGRSFLPGDDVPRKPPSVCVRTAARPGRRWLCSNCGKLLGVVLPGGVLQIRHGALRLDASLPASRQCEGCGQVETLEADG